MRPIKFRAWDGHKMIMPEDNAYYQHYISMCGSIVQKSSEGMDCFGGGDRWARAEPLELMQFTGLQDKVGVDIYEGDLISLHDNQRGFTKVVFRNAYVGGWLLVRNNNECSLGARRREDLEIVGNIYQNPELLENKA